MVAYRGILTGLTKSTDHPSSPQWVRGSPKPAGSYPPCGRLDFFFPKRHLSCHQYSDCKAMSGLDTVLSVGGVLWPTRVLLQDPCPLGLARSIGCSSLLCSCAYAKACGQDWRDYLWCDVGENMEDMQKKPLACDRAPPRPTIAYVCCWVRLIFPPALCMIKAWWLRSGLRHTFAAVT